MENFLTMKTIHGQWLTDLVGDKPVDNPQKYNVDGYNRFSPGIQPRPPKAWWESIFQVSPVP